MGESIFFFFFLHEGDEALQLLLAGLARAEEVGADSLEQSDHFYVVFGFLDSDGFFQVEGLFSLVKNLLGVFLGPTFSKRVQNAFLAGRYEQIDFVTFVYVFLDVLFHEGVLF